MTKAKKSKAPDKASKKKCGAKTMGEDVIDLDTPDSSVPSKAEEPMVTLEYGGKTLHVKWKLPEKLFTDLQATAQGIPKDSAQFNGYMHTQDHMQQAGVHRVKKFYRSILQVLTLDKECTGIPVTKHWGGLTNKFVDCKGRMHRQFNSMYVVTFKMAKDHRTLTSGPKFAGMANFGDVGLSNKNKNGGGGSGGEGGGGNVGGRVGDSPTNHHHPRR